MDMRRRHSTSVAIWPPLMVAHARNFFILLSHLCVSCAVPLPIVSSFTVICDVIFPIWNTLGILWCHFLMLVINSFDAHIRVSFSSFKEKRDKVWFILQWSRNLYSVDADTGDSALQIKKNNAWISSFLRARISTTNYTYESPLQTFTVLNCSGKSVVSFTSLLLLLILPCFSLCFGNECT